MARKHVISTEMMTYERKAPKTPFRGWGYTATRKLHTRATSPRLLKYRGCVASELTGKSFPDLKGVQDAFEAAAHACKAKV